MAKTFVIDTNGSRREILVCHECEQPLTDDFRMLVLPDAQALRVYVCGACCRRMGWTEKAVR